MVIGRLSTFEGNMPISVSQTERGNIQLRHRGGMTQWEPHEEVIVRVD
jgi:hypothetical protein